MGALIRPGQLPTIDGPFEVRVVVRGEDTAGVLAVIEETVPSRVLVPLHTHANDVWVHVLRGQVGALVGDEIAHAAPGEWLLKPRDVPHAMWNATDEPARIIELLTPAGTERWFEEIAALDDDDDDGFAESCRRHGISFHFDSPRNAELKHRFSLS